MITAITLLTLFMYIMLCLCQYITIGNGPWVLRYKEVFTLATVFWIVVLIESFK